MPWNATWAFRIYVPEEVTDPKGVIAFSNGTGEDRRYMTSVTWVQSWARSMGYAVLGSEVNFINTLNPTNTRIQIDTILNTAANITGRHSLANAPLFTVGNSEGGIDSLSLLPMYPERTLAASASKGSDLNNTYLSGNSGWTGVPSIWVPGETDDSSVVNPFAAQTKFQLWRNNGAAAAFALDYATGHSDVDNQYYDISAILLAEAHRLRHPGTVSPPPANRPTLTVLPHSSGWLAERTFFNNSSSSVNTLCNLTIRPTWPQIAPVANFTGNATSASWLPSEIMARVYR
ncbi:MAG: hypothetical protein N2035_10550, partial [Chthoniobacterales bacterium]|nr:hypothetical protein [Chthoniobacterales bacterium]